MAGLGSAQAGADAVYPQLYPDVVSSVPFITSLFDVEVETKEDGRKFTVKQYMEDETKAPWWSAILGFPFKVLGAIMASDEEEGEKTGLTISSSQSRSTSWWRLSISASPPLLTKRQT